MYNKLFIYSISYRNSLKEWPKEELALHVGQLSLSTISDVTGYL